MRKARLGQLDAVITGGDDRNGGGKGPVIVLLHGFGASATDLVGLERAIRVPKGTRFVFPAGPLDLSFMFGMGDARAWWMIDMMALQMAIQSGRFRELGGKAPEGLVPAREALDGLLDAVTVELDPAEGILLGGFSQGSMLAMDLALHSSRPLAGLALMSTTFLTTDSWTERLPNRAGLKVMQSHGRRDEILPFQVADALREQMVAAGIDLDFVPFSGGHEIPPVVLSHLEKLVAEVFDSRD